MTLVAGERNESLARKIFPEARILVWQPGGLKRLRLLLRVLLEQYDAVIDFHSYPFSTTSALLALLSRSSRRVGFWRPAPGEGLSRKVFNWGIPSPPENTHESEKSFLLVKKIFPRVVFRIGNLSPRFSSVEAASKSRLFYRQCGITGRDKVLAVHPTLDKGDNRWLQENYVLLLRLFQGHRSLKTIVVHGEGESRELEKFRRSIQGISNVFVLPESDIFFILEAAKRFNLMVCGDSGIMHACALSAKVFAIFGPSEPKRWGPLDLHGNRIFRKKGCLCDSVRPEEIASAVIKKIF